MKCRVSAFNAQVSRLIIVLIKLRAVKIYVAAVEVIRKKERVYETQFTAKIGEKSSLAPIYFTREILFPVMPLSYYAKTDHSRPLILGLYE